VLPGGKGSPVGLQEKRPHWEKWGLEGEYQSAKRVRSLNKKYDLLKQKDLELKFKTLLEKNS